MLEYEQHCCCALQPLPGFNQTSHNLLDRRQPTDSAELQTLQHQHQKLLASHHSLVEENDHCLANHAELMSQVRLRCKACQLCQLCHPFLHSCCTMPNAPNKQSFDALACSCLAFELYLHVQHFLCCCKLDCCIYFSCSCTIVL